MINGFLKRLAFTASQNETLAVSLTLKLQRDLIWEQNEKCKTSQTGTKGSAY